MNVEAFVKELEYQLKRRLDATPESPAVAPLFDVYMAVMAARKAAESPVKLCE